LQRLLPLIPEEPLTEVGHLRSSDPSAADDSFRLSGDVRLSKLPAPDRSFTGDLEGRQCDVNFGNSSTRSRPSMVIQPFHKAAL